MRQHTKVLQLRSSPFLGSPEKMIIGRCTVRSERSFEYYVGVFDEQPGDTNDFVTQLNGLGVKTARLQPSLLHFGESIKVLKHLVKNAGIDMICANDYKSDFFAFLVGRICRVPTVAVFHGRTGKNAKGRMYERIDGRVLRYFSAVVAVCEDAKARLMSRGVSAEKIHVVPNAVDTDIDDESTGVGRGGDIRREFHLSPADRVIVFAGRLSPEKGLGLLIEAARSVTRRYESVRFFFVGEGKELSVLQSLVERYNLSRHVVFTGFRKDVKGFFEVMDFLVLPSLTEGMPVVILEAFAAGKTVVATKVGGVPEVVDDGLNGLLVEPGNVVQLTAAIEQMLGDNATMREMGRQGRSLVREKYSFQSQVKNYEQVYRHVLERHHLQRQKVTA